jgi:hypothetical protein
MERRMEQIEESVARYLRQLDTADRQQPSRDRSAKVLKFCTVVARAILPRSKKMTLAQMDARSCFSDSFQAIN